MQHPDLLQTVRHQHQVMPELPEVETVRQGLLSVLHLPTAITSVTVHRQDLRFPVPTDLHLKLQNGILQTIDRRSKYLLWRIALPKQECTLISHLGMTGSWRLADAQSRRHDHLHLALADGKTLVYHDPRRFGYLDLAANDGADHPYLAHLGPEPLSDDFSVNHLKQALKNKKGPIKNCIMNNQVVVGVGNIYANESLFRAKINPHTAAGRISPARLATLTQAIKEILSEAIVAGGSTIKDFRQAGGSEGYFQHSFKVYGRANQPCTICQRPLQSAVLGGRATVWCPQCQRR